MQVTQYNSTEFLFQGRMTNLSDLMETKVTSLEPKLKGECE